MSKHSTKTRRVEARITEENLELVRRAAEIEGRSVSDFIVAASQQAARSVVAESQIITLSLEGQRRFAEALINPPEPNEALRRALETHRRLVGEP